MGEVTPISPSSLRAALERGTTFEITTVSGLNLSSGFDQSLADTHSAAEPDFNRIDYDSATGTYILRLNDVVGSNSTTAYTYAPPTLGTVTLNNATRTPFYGTNSNFVSFTAVNPRTPPLSDIESELFLYKVGPNNQQIQLTYVSFGVQVVNPSTAPFSPWSATGRETLFVYGLPTLAAGMPTSGTATYNGVVWGAASTPASGAFTAGVYDITGTSTLTANFSTSSLALALTFSGTPVAFSSQLVSGVPTMSVSANGSIGSVGFQNRISGGGDAGTFSGGFEGGASGTFTGRFYGPSAQEFGLNFNVVSGNVTGAGISVGKQQPAP